MKWLKWFFAGALAVPLAHQPMLALCAILGLTTRKPYPMTPTEPFGVPAVVSLSFWGGVWGVILALLLRRLIGPKYWIVAILFGAIAPTLVAAFIVPPLKGLPIGGDMKMALMGLLVNGAWGFGTALFARVLERKG
ncbi:MAG TPA: hypothetical protein VF618_13190 [Thermoanaerobaculia bacterium]